jgi:putative cell wall-binding protein
VRVIDHNVGVDFEKDTAPLVREYPSRLAGADRFATAVEISQFSHPNGADVVYVAVGHNYPDAISSAPAAAAEGAPILLVNPTSVPASTEAELNRLGPNQIVVLGGSAAISDGVVTYLDARFPTVVRRSGPTRYETAAAINQGAFPGTVGTVYIATGENFPDALVAGPAAIKDGGSLLLVRPDEIPAAIAAELTRMQPDRIVVIGSSAAVNDSVFQQLQAYAPTTRIGGADRFALSAEVARVVFPNSKTVYVATGLNYPDALTAAPATTAASGPILLVGSSIPGTVNTEMLRTGRQTIIVLGGPAAVSDAILYQLVMNYLPN